MFQGSNRLILTPLDVCVAVQEYFNRRVITGHEIVIESITEMGSGPDSGSYRFWLKSAEKKEKN